VLKSTVLGAVESAKQAVGDLAIPANLIRRGEAIFVPGSPPTYPETQYDVKIVITSFQTKEIDEQRIRSSDRKGLIFPESGQPTPQPNDLIEAGGSLFRIIYNDKVMAGDAVALSQVHLRLV
jgi:hypothetical protein